MTVRKILSLCAVSAVTVFGAFAVDSKATVTMEGSIIKETQNKGADPEFAFFNLDPLTSKDKNKISFDVDSGIAGAHFELSYLIDGTAKAEYGWAVTARNTYLWFTPVDALNLRIGYVGDSSYFVEEYYGERVANPFNYVQRGVAVPAYITNADTDEMGFGFTVFPVEGLELTASIAPGIGKAGFALDSDNSDFSYAQWGAAAKYSVNENISVQASYRDNGSKSWKVLRAGVGYTNENIFAFLQPVFGFEYSTLEENYSMGGFALDIYGKAQFDALQVSLHLPLTFRTTGLASDPSYLEAFLQVKYNLGYVALLDDFSPYLKVETPENTPALLNENFTDSLALEITPGVEFSVGICNADIGFCLSINQKSSGLETVTWSIPFGFGLTF